MLSSSVTTDVTSLPRKRTFLIRLSDEGFTLLRMSELKQQLEMRLSDDAFTYEELEAVVVLLAGPGHVWQLEFGRFVLLHPERINSYAAALGRTVARTSSRSE